MNPEKAKALKEHDEVIAAILYEEADPEATPRCKPQ